MPQSMVQYLGRSGRFGQIGGITSPLGLAVIRLSPARLHSGIRFGTRLAVQTDCRKRLTMKEGREAGK